MSGWTILPIVLGFVGIGGTAAFFIFGGGGALAAFGLLRLIPSPAGIWRFLTHPVGVILTMAALAFGGFLVGQHRGKVEGAAACERRIQESVEAARLADASIAEERRRAALDQAKQAEAREAAVKDEVRGYAEELTKRAEAACKAGADADRFNDGLGVSDDAISGGAPIPPARPGRGPVSGTVPQGARVR
jgi:hypothetical protein